MTEVLVEVHRLLGEPSAPPQIRKECRGHSRPSPCAGSMNITVVIETGRKITLAAEPTNTVGQLWSGIQDQTGTPWDQCRTELMFRGRALQFDRTLSDYNI